MDLEVKKLLSFLLVLIFILTPITYAENNTNTLNQNKTLTENNTNVSQTFNHPLSGRYERSPKTRRIRR